MIYDDDTPTIVITAVWYPPLGPLRQRRNRALFACDSCRVELLRKASRTYRVAASRISLIS